MAKKSRYWAFIVYPESLPDHWLETLGDYHLPMAISPLHDLDINADMSVKKAHYHVLVCYGNTTTQGPIKEISESVNGTEPIPIVSVKGYYRYLTHKDNPEKVQYKEEQIVKLSGFDPADYYTYTKEEELKIKIEIHKYIMENSIIEYIDLLEALAGYDIVLYDYVTTHTLLYNAMVTSLRNKLKMSEKKK